MTETERLAVAETALILAHRALRDGDTDKALQILGRARVQLAADSNAR